MRQNKVLFGTPEVRTWLLSRLRPADAPADDKIALRMIFSDFYSEIAHQRNDPGAAKASKALTMLELRDASLKTRDSARNALADELRALLGSFSYFFVTSARLTSQKGAVGISSDQYRSKFPWGTFWFILFRHNKCLTNWPDPKLYPNALNFSSKSKDDWCFLLRQFKVEGDKSTNPALVARICESMAHLS
jgi:hypothetical protein